MKVILHLFVIAAIATVSRGDVTGTYNLRNTCFCFNRNRVNITSMACYGWTGLGQYGQCFRYTGTRSNCFQLGRRHEFFQINWNGRNGWVDGLYMNRESDYRCGGSSRSSVSEVSPRADEYTCNVSQSDSGKRINEGSSRDDCRDCSGRDTCRGGQCVALVKCRCQRNGRYAPQTSCWRPGRNVINSDGKCDRTIAPNTAIATFTDGAFFGHAAAFIRCTDDETFEIYDQWCSKSFGLSSSSNSRFATIKSSGTSSCAGATRNGCQTDNPDRTRTTACYSHREDCLRRG